MEQGNRHAAGDGDDEAAEGRLAREQPAADEIRPTPDDATHDTMRRTVHGYLLIAAA